MKIKQILLISLLAIGLVGCESTAPSSDEIQFKQQEQILLEGTAQTGMPAIKNYRERKMLKQIFEERDQADFVTYTYLDSEMPVRVPGVTALGGKLTYVGVSVGYPIPYATEYTSPQKPYYDSTGSTGSTGYAMPLADPNGLFSPSSAEGSWIEMKTPNGQSKPQYFEPRLVTLTYQLPFDK